ncbi:hypothetical protein DCAR_0519442 [Daucus carota subsp. sativus]|uniref:C2 domain-containing protein n=1 Tax=Daucus carota subsp. sativus TaxID=79200 RepID=A0A164XYW6_DAUCS|nr:hypothetical protein DCAR_0519442 [Daucus carota subsp. sativus]
MRGGYDKGGKDSARERMAVCIVTGGKKACRGSGCSVETTGEIEVWLEGRRCMRKHGEVKGLNLQHEGFQFSSGVERNLDDRFLTKLLTEDLPQSFVRPKKIVLDFQKGKAVGLLPTDFRSGEVQEGNKDYAGELSVTLVDARKLFYVFPGKTDSYVILKLGDQVIRSKKNSQTTVIGSPGEPIWNQDISMLVTNPRKEKMYRQVNDSLSFADLIVSIIYLSQVDLGSLKDTVPADRIVTLQGGRGPFGKGSAGELLLQLTYKAYVEDEEDEVIRERSTHADASDDDMA